VPRIRPKYLLLAVALSSVAASWVGCATSNATSGTTSSGEGGSSMASTGPSGPSGTGTGGAGGAVGAGGACMYSSTEQATLVPLDLIVVLDRSGSMYGAKWDGSKAALSQFFNDPASAGISVGLLFFPNLISYDTACDFTAYEILPVPIGVLPGNSFALTNSMPAIANGQNTPMLAALKGAAFAAAAYQDANPTHKVNIVLATDGDPWGCDNVTINDIANTAQGVLNYNGVHTYVLGMEGSIIPNLNQVAAAGGTGMAYDITNDINQFSKAMADIRQAALGCEFAIPPPPQGMEFHSDDVNFTYRAGGMGVPATLPRADDLADCGGKPGWYYDNNKKPTKIILCPASCSVVENDPKAEVSIAYGCHSSLN
jgi:von Willebrand factor type A domain-containing protein